MAPWALQGLGPGHLKGPPGHIKGLGPDPCEFPWPLWAPLGPVWAGRLWVGLLWAPWARVGWPLWAGPLQAPLGPCEALWVGPFWAPRALVSPLGACGPCHGRALVCFGSLCGLTPCGPTGPLWARHL